MRYFAVLVHFLGIAVLSLGIAANTVAQTAPPTPEQQAQASAETRQGLFKLINFNLAPLAAMLKGQPFDAAVAQKSALHIAQLAPMIPDVFEADTTRFEVKTRARPAVWNSKADFLGKADELARAATALSQVAGSGDKDATLKAVRTMAKACGNCHDDYRDK